MSKNQWVVRHGDGWAQRGEGDSRVTRTFVRRGCPVIIAT